MALTPVNAFTPAAYAIMAVGATSSNIAVPGSDNQTLYLANNGPQAVTVLLGADDTVVVTPSTGLTLLPGQSIYLGIGMNTFLAAIAAGATISSRLYIAAGA